MYHNATPNNREIYGVKQRRAEISQSISSQVQIRHRVERAGTDLIVATLPSLIYYVRLHA